MLSIVRTKLPDSTSTRSDMSWAGLGDSLVAILIHGEVGTKMQVAQEKSPQEIIQE
mgnify:CR=1 FL=1